MARDEDVGTSSLPKRPKLEENGLILPDPTLLECPLCHDPLTIPVYQCSRGDIACTPCCKKFKNKCTKCTRKIGQIRCILMEKVLESIKIPCQYEEQGCLEKISYCGKLEHEKTCNFNFVSCANISIGCMGKVRFFEKIDHEKTCQYTPVPCVNTKYGCLKKVNCLTKLDHEKTCKYTLVPCVNTKHGCLEKVSCLTKFDHEKTCKYTPVPCVNMNHGCLEIVSCQKRHDHERTCKYAPVPCVNMKHGCLEILSCLTKLDHEKTCTYTPMPCPRPGCKYVDMHKHIYLHHVEKHLNCSKPVTLNSTSHFTLTNDKEHILLQESDEKVIFVLTRVVDPLGSFVNVRCALPTGLDKKFSYELTIIKDDNSISLKSSMELTPQCSQQPAKEKCLVIRNDFHETAGSSKILFLLLTIRK